MKTTGLGTRAQVLADLRQSAEDLRAKEQADIAKFESMRGRDLAKEAGIPPGTQSWNQVTPEVRATYERLWREQSEAQQAIHRAISDTRAILQPLASILRTLDGMAPVGEIQSRHEIEAYYRQGLADSTAKLRRMLVALGPDLAKQFPIAQLEVLEKSLADDIAELKKHVPERPTAQGSYGSYGGYGAPSAQVVKEPVIATLAKVADLGAAAKVLAEKLGVAEADVLGAAAKLDGADKARFTTAVRGYALLADFATGTLDYRRIGMQMTAGSPGCDRTDHRARSYSGHHVEASRARHGESKRTLAEGLKTALASAKPAEAMEGALSKHLFHELGVPEKVTAGWAPKLDAVVRALDGEAFAPLRALNELLPNGSMFRYGPPLVEALQATAQKITRAIVEGRFPESRLDEPANHVQLAVLPREAERTKWLGNHRTESTGTRGQKVSSHEAEGLDLLWATKIGGPSHGFDNMAQCALSVIGNVRTKAIIVEDGDWHQPAARAYMRLLQNDQGRPMLFVESPQIDFRLQTSSKLDHGAIEDRVLAHAVARARELGTDLVVAERLRGALERAGHGYARFAGQLVLEPSAVVNEASDSIVAHDEPQLTKLRRPPYFGFVEVKL